MTGQPSDTGSAPCIRPPARSKVTATLPRASAAVSAGTPDRAADSAKRRWRGTGATADPWGVTGGSRIWPPLAWRHPQSALDQVSPDQVPLVQLRPDHAPPVQPSAVHDRPDHAALVQLRPDQSSPV